MATIRRREGGTNSTVLKRREYSTAFSPTSIAGCSLWLDGADTTSVSFSSGSNVSNWNDKSGNGRNGTVYNGTPTYTLESGMMFNGSSSLQVSYPASPTLESLFVIVKFNSVSAQGDIFSGTSTGQREYLMYSPYSPGTMFLGRYGTAPSGAINGGTVMAGSIYFLGYVFNGTGNTISFFQSGNTITSGTPQFTYGSGGSISLIGSYGGGGFLQGQVYEMIVYNTALDSTQRQTVESYLAQKWGLIGSLPAGHRQFTQPAGKPNSVTDAILGIYYILKPSTSSPITATVLNAIATYLRNFMSEFRNPSFYGYNLDGTSYSITDGGGDMYDGGNWTYPWLISGTQFTGNSGSIQAFSINYASTTATTVDTSFIYASLGYATSSGSTITANHPLTVLGFRNTTGHPVGFQLAGNSGADGGGILASGILYAGDIIQGFTVHAFYRETYNATDPSHCNLFILLGHPSWGSVFGTISSFADPVANGGNGCYFFTSGAGVSNILAIQTLLSKAGGALVTSTECQTVIQAFVNRVKLAVGF